MALYSVKPLYSPSATVTAGSDIVQVTGSVNCSFVMSGSIVNIAGGNRLVDAISGTGVDGSGNSTIKLRRPWAGTTISGPMLVFMSYEGLSDAVFQLKGLIDTAAASVEGAFNFMGDWDILAEDALPPTPADGSGSQMWRISTTATVATVEYVPDDLIYYDQYLAIWRKFSENKAYSNDARFSDSREWTAATVAQAEAEAGTATTRRAWTAQRVFQAIAAWWNASAFKTKLDGIAAEATANNTDAFLLARANHTGTQAASTITGLGTAAVADIVGTVSESGGVPTGAIIQRGSNANGEFVLFADGLAIALSPLFTLSNNVATGSLFVSGAIQTWDFPITFVETPSLSGYVSNSIRWMTFSGATNSSVSLASMATVSSSTALAGKAMAIGKWY